MARQIIVADGTHRLEQEAYRDGLARRREPEVGRADTAVAVAVYGLLCEIARKDRVRGQASRDEFIGRAADVLEAQGYDRARSVAVLRRRLAKPPERFLRLLGIDVAEDCAHYEATA